MNPQRAVRLVFEIPAEVWCAFISNMPGRLGEFLRYRFWKRRLKSLGKQVRIGTGVSFVNPECISIGDSTWIDKNVVVLAGSDSSTREIRFIENPGYHGNAGEVTIGSNVHIGVGCIISGIAAGVSIGNDCTFSAYCAVYAFTHHYRSFRNPHDRNVAFGSMVAPSRQCLLAGAVVTEANTGIALNSVLLPGVNLRADSFVAIGSIVKAGVYGPNALVAGHPAKVVATRYDHSDGSAPPGVVG